MKQLNVPRKHGKHPGYFVFADEHEPLVQALAEAKISESIANEVAIGNLFSFHSTEENWEEAKQARLHREAIEKQVIDAGILPEDYDNGCVVLGSYTITDHKV